MTSLPLDAPATASRREPLVIAAATDDAFAMGLGVTLYSALENYQGSRPVEVYVMDGGISPANRRRIDRVASHFDTDLHWLDALNDRLRGLRPISRVTMPTYYRLLIPELLPPSHRRMIFLDSDIVVLGDLEELWERDLGESVLLASQDHDTSLLKDVLKCSELGLPPDLPYFNSGVLLLDLERWREENLGNRVIDYARDNLHMLTFAEQDAMNAMLHGRWGKFELRWNLFATDMDQFSTDTAEASLRGLSAKAMIAHLRSLPDAPRIVHFAGQRKPWAGRMNHPTRLIFFHYLRESGWFGPREWLAFLPAYAIERAKGKLLDTRRNIRRWWRKTVKSRMVSS